MAQFIVKTPPSGLDFLGVGGVQVIANHKQIRQLLQSRFGQAHANLLAEPKRDGSTGPIDWYSTQAGPPRELRKLTQLSEPEAVRHRDRLAMLLAEVREFADRIGDSKSADEKLLSRRLQAAITYPSDDFVYLIGDDLVLVCWGCQIERASQIRPDLVKPIDVVDRRARAASGTAEAAVAGQGAAAAGDGLARPVVIAASTSWLSLLAILLLITFMTLLTRLLVPACGLAMPSGSSVYGWCPALAPVAAAPVPQSRGASDETAALQNELAALERRLVATPCPEEKPAPPPERRTEVPKQPEREEMDRRLAEQRAKTGEVTVSLFWDNGSDLDLSLVCPSGSSIAFNARNACGGELDVDMNFLDRRSDKPVENINFQDGKAQPGRYRVVVNNRDGSSGSVPFRILIKIKGTSREVTGTVSQSDGGKSVTEFEVD